MIFEYCVIGHFLPNEADNFLEIFE